MNIAEILKDKPKGFHLYSPIFGECKLVLVHNDDLTLPIVVEDSDNLRHAFTADGKYKQEGECILFPSKDNRDWNTINDKKFDINSLKPFDKVLARDNDDDCWRVSLFGYDNTNSCYRFSCIEYAYKQCVPYNDDTKHLLGTDELCSPYYINW